MEIVAVGLAYGFGSYLLRATPLIPFFGSTEGVKKEQKIVKGLAQRMGITEMIEVRRTPLAGLFEYSAFGAIGFPFANSILIPQKSLVQKEAKVFTYAQEIAHLERGDNLKIGIVMQLALIVIGLVAFIDYPIEVALVIGIVAAIAMEIFITRRYEEKTDEQICGILTDDEIIGGVLKLEQKRLDQRRIYLNAKEGKGTFLGDLFGRMHYNEVGDSCFDLCHQSLTKRISTLRSKIRDQEKRNECYLLMKEL